MAHIGYVRDTLEVLECIPPQTKGDYMSQTKGDYKHTRWILQKYAIGES